MPALVGKCEEELEGGLPQSRAMKPVADQSLHFESIFASFREGCLHGLFYLAQE